MSRGQRGSRTRRIHKGMEEPYDPNAVPPEQVNVNVFGNSEPSISSSNKSGNGSTSSAGGGQKSSKNQSGKGQSGKKPSAKSNKGQQRSYKPKKPNIDEAAFWSAPAPIPDAPDRISIADQPAAVVRSLGQPPLSGRETISEHYFEAVYGRSVGLASALAAAGGLLQDDS